MAKKKKNVPVAVEAPASGGEVVASDLSPEAHMANLKDLNRLLLKDTVERREQIHQLRSELSALAADRDILNETERDVCGIVLSSSISDAAARSTAEMDAAAETAGKMLKKAESIAAELNAAEMQLVVVAREKDRVESDLERLTEERDLSRSDLDEKCKDYVDLEERFRLLKRELAEMSKEREVADAKCGKLEEEGRRMKGELRSVMCEKDLLERSREDAKHLVEKLGREMEVLKSQKDVDMDTLNASNKANASKVEALEEECRLLKETICQLENEAGDLKVSIEEMEEENLSLVVRSEESEKEKLELEKAFDMKEKEMALQINELKEKMTMMEDEKNMVEIQISSLQAEISVLQSARKSLEDAHSSCCKKISMKESYCADMQREKNLKAEEIVSLQMQLNESLKNLHIMEITIEQLQRELNRVTAENEEAKKQIDCSKVEKASLKKHLETSNQRLQDAEKKLKALEDSSGQVFALFKKMTAEVRTQENHINRVNEIVEVDNDEERKLFVDNLEAIKVAVKRKETIIKDLNQKLELLQLSVAHEKNKMRIWKWLFPATTGIFAAASLAYAAKQAR
ncbi:unconventional myosin-XVIIIa [Dendrobium catenatum]|uniref:unconventional myosin-XVIIIa n=1 Tax=Dendrobium catenatum TaxID=906689 RepID=UPI0009F2FC60|nr:unconventional myosin-XVIIIa [Dendrobium catenatum]